VIEVVDDALVEAIELRSRPGIEPGIYVVAHRYLPPQELIDAVINAMPTRE
jgi:hypothetical protein